MTETTQRILDLMQNNNLNAHQLEVAVGLPNASIQSWVKGKKRKNGEMAETMPSTDSITKLARYFNVSADYLLCLTDKPKPLENHEVGEISDNTPAIFGEMSDLLSEQRFVDSAKMYRALPNEYRQEVYAYIRGLIMGLGLPIQQILGRK